VLNLAPQNHGWLARYWPVHTETARLFLEAGEELLDRLDNTHKMTAARPPGRTLAQRSKDGLVLDDGPLWP